MVANRIALALALLLFGATAANAQTERTSAMWSCNPTADWRSIRFRVLGTQIRHGINRDFPTDYPGP